MTPMSCLPITPPPRACGEGEFFAGHLKPDTHLCPPNSLDTMGMDGCLECQQAWGVKADQSPTGKMPVAHSRGTAVHALAMGRKGWTEN